MNESRGVVADEGDADGGPGWDNDEYLAQTKQDPTTSDDEMLIQAEAYLESDAILTRATAKPLFCAALITLPARCTAPGLTTQSVDCPAAAAALEAAEGRALDDLELSAVHGDDGAHVEGVHGDGGDSGLLEAGPRFVDVVLRVGERARGVGVDGSRRLVGGLEGAPA